MYDVIFVYPHGARGFLFTELVQAASGSSGASHAVLSKAFPPAACTLALHRRLHQTAPSW